MIGPYIVVGVTLFLLFALFLVAGKTLNGTINVLIKLEYLLQKEHDLKKEALEVRKMLEEQARAQAEVERQRKEAESA